VLDELHLELEERTVVQVIAEVDRGVEPHPLADGIETFEDELRFGAGELFHGPTLSCSGVTLHRVQAAIIHQAAKAVVATVTMAPRMSAAAFFMVLVYPFDVELCTALRTFLRPRIGRCGSAWTRPEAPPPPEPHSPVSTYIHGNAAGGAQSLPRPCG